MTGPIFMLAGGLPHETAKAKMMHLLKSAISWSSNPVLVYIGAAHGDKQEKVATYAQLAMHVGFSFKHLSLFSPVPDINSLIEISDALFIDGGNTRSLLALMKAWHIDKMLLNKIKGNPIIISGVSAGMNCWFEWAVTDSWADQYKIIPCLGWLKGFVASPHWDSEPDRQYVLLDFIRRCPSITGLAVEDNCVVHISGDSIQAYPLKRNARAYMYKFMEGAIEEEQIKEGGNPPQI